MSLVMPQVCCVCVLVGFVEILYRQVNSSAHLARLIFFLSKSFPMFFSFAFGSSKKRRKRMVV